MDQSYPFFLTYAKVLAAAVISLMSAFLIFWIAGAVFHVWGREALRVMFLAVIVDMIALQTALIALVWFLRRSGLFSREEKSEWSKRLLFNPVVSIFYFIRFVKGKTST